MRVHQRVKRVLRGKGLHQFELRQGFHVEIQRIGPVSVPEPHLAPRDAVVETQNAARLMHQPRQSRVVVTAFIGVYVIGDVGAEDEIRIMRDGIVILRLDGPDLGPPVAMPSVQPLQSARDEIGGRSSPK